MKNLSNYKLSLNGVKAYIEQDTYEVKNETQQ
jgi:hypothetical protein